jgi:TRAP-type C4-dicarboxylate transport system substrate-binding protein
MKTKREVYRLVVSVMVISIIAFTSEAFTQSNPTSTMKPVTLQMNSTVFRTDSSYGKGMKWFTDEVTKRTNSLIKWKIIPPFSLTKPGEEIDALKNRLSDAAFLVAIYYPTKLYLTNFDHAVFGGSTDIDKANIWGESFIHDRATMIHRELEKEGMKMLFAPVNPGFELMTKERISKLDDLKGKKIAVSGHFAEAQVRASGAVALTPTMVDRGTMLQTGALDGSIIPRDQSCSFKLFEYTKYSMPLWGCWFATFGVMNLDLFNSLPKDIQKVLIDIGREATTYIWQLARDDQPRLAKLMADAGHSILPSLSEVERNKWLQLGGEPIRAWLTEASTRGVGAEAKELMNAYFRIQEEKIGYVWPDQLKKQLR